MNGSKRIPKVHAEAVAKHVREHIDRQYNGVQRAAERGMGISQSVFVRTGWCVYLCHMSPRSHHPHLAVRTAMLIMVVSGVSDDPREGTRMTARVYDVYDYASGEKLQGSASARLVVQSLEELTGTGAVGAYRDDAGVWQWVDMPDPRRTHVVYVD